MALTYDFILGKLRTSDGGLVVAGGLVPKGAYNGATTYAIGDSVDYLGSSYIATSITVGNLPTDTSKWQVLANKGNTGSTGSQGIQGVTGNNGADGVGIPSGGTTGQVLNKASNTNYDTQWHTLVKGDVGLSSVDNTSDVGKPVSTAQQTALDLKAPLASPTFTGTVVVPDASFANAKLANMVTKTYKGRTSAGTGVPEDVAVATLKTDLVLVKADVGLGNVVNSDTTTTANITDSSNKRFITDAQQTVLGNTSGTNTGDQTLPVGGTPALTLGTTNAAGSSPNFLRRDDTVLVFDATSPSTQAYGDSAVVGVATTAARRDHKHAMPATVKDTTAVSGVLKGSAGAVVAAINSDLPSMSSTVGGAVPTPPNNTTTFLRGDATFATPPQPDITQDLIAPTTDELITAGYSAYISDYYEIASGKYLEAGLNSVFEVG